MAARCLIGWPIVSDVNATYTPTFSGGAWSASLPLTNLQDRRLAKVARSTSAALASTQFDVDLKRAARVGLIALPNHTISQAGTVRLRGWSAAPCFDSLTVGDASWSLNGTPTRTPAAFTCADGLTLDLIGDDNNALAEGFLKTVAFTGNGTKAVRFRIARFASYPASAFYITDATAGPTRLLVAIDFTSAVPVCTIGGGAGAVISTTARGDGSFDVLCTTTAGVVAANTNRIGIYAANNAAADLNSLYVGNVTAWDAATDQQVYDSGAITVWPAVYPAGSLAVGDPRLVTGKHTAEEAAGFNIGFCHIPSAVQTAQYWRVEISDPTNAAGYVDVGRLVMAATYQPSINMSQGAKLSLSSATTRTETDGGAAVYNDKPRRREQVFTVDYLTEDEALVNFFDMQRRIGTSGQLYFAHNAADTYHLHRRAFLCTMRELSAIEYPFGTNANVPFAVIEEL